MKWKLLSKSTTCFYFFCRYLFSSFLLLLLLVVADGVGTIFDVFAMRNWEEKKRKREKRMADAPQLWKWTLCSTNKGEMVFSFCVVWCRVKFILFFSFLFSFQINEIYCRFSHTLERSRFDMSRRRLWTLRLEEKQQ